MRKLTAKQKAFADEYLVDLNATQAAKRAGYSEKTAGQQGERLLKKVEISTYIQENMDKRAERTQITQDYVLNGIVETIERCRQAAPVLDRKGERIYVETPDGEIAPAFQFDSKGTLKGYELLGKHLKLFTDKHEHSGPDDGPIEIKEIRLIPGDNQNAEQ